MRILEMIKRWTITLAAFLCIIQPCMAQPVNHHKSSVKHKHIAHSSKKHTSHKLKHSTAHSSEQFSKSTAISKPIFTEVPQPQFDTNYSTDITADNFQTLSTTALPVSDTYNNADTSIDTSQQALTTLAYQTVETQHYSSYKFGGTVFDPSQGIYKIDCSAYINSLLSQANPQAYSSLTGLTQTIRPTSHDYYNFITRLPEKPVQYWRKINAVDQLQPGGILVFLTKYLHRRHWYSNGHVMLVMSKPVPSPIAADTYQVKVADSASSGHSDDTRLPHKSGIGIGTLLLKINPFTGQPTAYAWKLDDHWRGHTLFAMAQPIGAT